MNSTSLPSSYISSDNLTFNQPKSTRYHIPNFQTSILTKTSINRYSSDSQNQNFIQRRCHTSRQKNRIGKYVQDKKTDLLDVSIDKHSSLPIEYITASIRQNRIKLQNQIQNYHTNKINYSQVDQQAGCKLFKNPKEVLYRKRNSTENIIEPGFLQIKKLSKNMTFQEPILKKQIYSVRASQNTQIYPKMRHESSADQKIYCTLLKNRRENHQTNKFSARKDEASRQQSPNSRQQSPNKSKSNQTIQSLVRLKNKVDSYIALMNDIQSKAQLTLSTCTSIQFSDNSPRKTHKKAFSFSKQNIDFSNFSPSKQPGQLISHTSRKIVKASGLSDFSILKQIGSGSFGNIYAAVHIKTNSLYALKKISKEYVRKNNLIQRVLLQIKIQSFIDHPNIVKLFGYFDDNQSVYMILQYMEQGSLYSQMMAQNFHKSTVKLFTQEKTATMIAQILKGVTQLHQYHVIHRDIKPENIVISFDTCKLCDLGWSVVNSQNQRRNTACGTFDYTAPQILKNQPYDERVDLWEVGILAYQLMTGQLPFYHPSKKQTYMRITNFSGNLEFPSHVPHINRNFIKGLIQKNANQRISAKSMLQHGYLRQFE